MPSLRASSPFFAIRANLQRRGRQRLRRAARTNFPGTAQVHPQTRRPAPKAPPTSRTEWGFRKGGPAPTCLSKLYLDGDAGREVETHQGIDHARVGVQDVDDPLVCPHLELLPRVLVDER